MSENLHVKIIPCEDIDVQDSPTARFNSLINPQIKFRVPFVPTAFSFAIMIIVSGMYENTDYNIQINVIKDENIVYTTGNNIINLPQVSDNFNFNLNLKNIAFYSSGEYKIQMKINEETFEDMFWVIANDTAPSSN